MIINKIAIIVCLVGVGISYVDGSNETISHFDAENPSNSTVESFTTSVAPAKTAKQTSSCFSSEKKRTRCCKKRIVAFKTKWFTGRKYLQTFFQELKVLKCRSELKEICEQKVYSKFSDYSRLVVASHCAQDEFEKECLPLVTSLRKRPQNSTWSDVISDMTSSEFTTEELLQPCVQVAIYGSISGGYGFYHEIVDTYIPFCDISWCGVDLKTLKERKISSWACMPSRCRTNLIIVSVVCALLAAAIILSNITVIIVFTTSPKLRNSQAVYKISLAIADLLVGAIVLPTFISSLMILYQGQAEMGGILSKVPNSEGTLPRKAGGFNQRFSSEYLNFVGFFTMLSLMVSIYTLMTASFDRFMAIYQPLRYGHHNAKRIAIWSSLGLWVFAIFFSAMPLFVPAMVYGLAASIMVASQETAALIMYAVVVLVPLILVWTTTIATYSATRTHARMRQSMRVRRGSGLPGKKKTTGSMEARLARTLASMVGVFTVCLLPAAIVLIIPHALVGIYPDRPGEFNLSSHKAFISAEFVTILILMTNSLWNCFIYNSRSDDFKKTARLLYAKLLRILGLNAVWKKTRGFATSTIRLRRSTLTTSLLSLNSSLRSGAYRKKSEGEQSKAADDIKARNASESCASTNVYRYAQDVGKMESEFGPVTISGNVKTNTNEETPENLDAVFENDTQATS